MCEGGGILPPSAALRGSLREKKRVGFKKRSISSSNLQQRQVSFHCVAYSMLFCLITNIHTFEHDLLSDPKALSDLSAPCSWICWLVVVAAGLRRPDDDSGQGSCIQIFNTHHVSSQVLHETFVSCQNCLIILILGSRKSCSVGAVHVKIGLLVVESI